ncbi:MAG: hypothetical protein M3N11_02005 [Actinomycetota bacterium]|nr:hypothetical protein [Actinomycetota bacterium]
MLRYLYRAGQMKGLLGGSRPWTIVWALLFGARMLKKAVRRESEVVHCSVLEPGDGLVIRHEGRPERPPKR